MSVKKDQIAKAVTAGTVGTTAMTAFSYMLSQQKDRNFREPRLLAGMMEKLTTLNKDEATKIGWLVHYSVGIFFALVYQSLVEKRLIQANVKSGLVIGGITGLFGVAIWHLTRSLHPKPPRTNYRKFYGQLVVAHIIFGTITIILLRRKNTGSGVLPAVRF